MSNKIILTDLAYKELNTIEDLEKWLKFAKEHMPKETKLKMFRDEEGNQINKILSLHYDGENIYFVPWEE